MAKKSKKPTKKKPSPVSPRVHKRLTKELKNARARIRGMMDNLGAAYSGPKIEDFYMDNVLALVKSGVHINTVYAMIRNTNARNIRAQSEASNDIVSNLYGGEPVTRKEYTKLMKAISTANRNIQKAIDKSPELEPIMPAFLTPEEIERKVINKSGLEEEIKAIKKAFVPSKLVPIAINDEGEAGTQAEIEYLRNYVNKENKKREENRQVTKDIKEKHGRLLTQQEFGLEEIDVTQWETLDQWRRYTQFFTDARTSDRANAWLMNYTNTLNALSIYLKTNRGLPSDSITQQQLAKIFELISKIRDERTVRTLTRFSENIGIQQNYFGESTEIATIVSNMYDAWIDFEKEYML